jgi:hypothetical protein
VAALGGNDGWVLGVVIEDGCQPRVLLRHLLPSPPRGRPRLGSRLHLLVDGYAQPGDPAPMQVGEGAVQVTEGRNLNPRTEIGTLAGGDVFEEPGERLTVADARGRACSWPAWQARHAIIFAPSPPALRSHGNLPLDKHIPRVAYPQYLSLRDLCH